MLIRISSPEPKYHRRKKESMVTRELSGSLVTYAVMCFATRSFRLITPRATIVIMFP